MDTLQLAVQKNLNGLICRVRCGLGWPKERVLDGVEIPMEGTILRGDCSVNCNV